MNKQVVYIISLPRSGSTLLQKLLSTSQQASTVAEPWFMLPLLSLFHREYKAPYNSRMTYEAVGEFAESLQKQGIDLKAITGQFAEQVYSSACGEETSFFVDKTPRYYYHLTALQQMMPRAKYIYLFRNPLEVLASKIRMRQNTLKGFAIYRNDVLLAPFKMLEGLREAPEHCLILSFDRLVRQSHEVATQIGQFLSVSDIHPEKIAAVSIEGKMGDPVAMAEQRNIHVAHQQWTNVVNSWVRYRIFKRVLHTIPEEFFEYCGTNKTNLLSMLKSSRSIRLLHPVRIALDLFHLAYSAVNTAMKSARA